MDSNTGPVHDCGHMPCERLHAGADVLRSVPGCRPSGHQHVVAHRTQCHHVSFVLPYPIRSDHTSNFANYVFRGSRGCRAIWMTWLIITTTAIPVAISHGVINYPYGDHDYTTCMFQSNMGYNLRAFQVTVRGGDFICMRSASIAHVQLDFSFSQRVRGRGAFVLCCDTERTNARTRPPRRPPPPEFNELKHTHTRSRTRAPTSHTNIHVERGGRHAERSIYYLHISRTRVRVWPRVWVCMFVCEWHSCGLVARCVSVGGAGGGGIVSVRNRMPVRLRRHTRNSG